MQRKAGGIAQLAELHFLPLTVHLPAIDEGRHYAFETTLGGRTVPQRIREASHSHDVMIWFCGLASPDQHLARVRTRVASGGHDIPEAKIRARWDASRANLIALLPHIAHLQVYDNSTDAMPGEAIRDPRLVLEMVDARCIHPVSAESLAQTPDWAKPLVEAALAPPDTADPDRSARR